MTLPEIIGNLFIISGIIFMIFGVIGIYKFRNFYSRMLIASKVDTVGAMTLIIGVAIRHGFTFFTAKILLIMITLLIILPLVTHVISKAAYESGYPLQNLRNKK